MFHPPSRGSVGHRHGNNNSGNDNWLDRLLSVLVHFEYGREKQGWHGAWDRNIGTAAIFVAVGSVRSTVDNRV